MKFSLLLKTAGIDPIHCTLTQGAEGNDPDIQSVHYRSQSVEPGGLFVAIAGHAADGHDFIENALFRGAVAVIAQQPVKTDVPWAQVTDSRNALAKISACFYGAPSDALVLIGITGTNGKTTVTYIMESILAKAGKASGVIGTINYRYAGKCIDAPVTTPESLDLQRILAEMRANGITHVAMEASSHGIDLSRVAACRLDVAAFTNLTQDHLDYHGTLANYWACKKRLFTELLEEGPKKDRAVAVINCDNAHGRELIGLLTGRTPARKVISYGSEETCSIRPVDCIRDGSGIRGGIHTPAGRFSFRSSLVGRYNLENILCAVGISLALNLPLSAIREGIDALKQVPGRLAPVENKTGRFVFVDYAHTPDALENVLDALNELKTGRLICVFGCGGDRDRKKRPMMGKIAAERADLVVVTSDNPRTEAPDQIVAAIVSGISPVTARRFNVAQILGGSREKGIVVETDRKAAIGLGLMAADSGDMVLIAGKGHETYQILGTQKVAFDDREVASAVLRKLEQHSDGQA
ncbi:MAG: UDP-N-acetylmuramoyl-L-alanyl-D-glutamate--2,6-diaminopimelate ligase [Desulfobacterales bacterium]|nr:UDP-N-acetylmuramoyl-L-alanyl-D-glutamate--2,6-diaminopimelate ligase [Desulfobacterales bacterium]